MKESPRFLRGVRLGWPTASLRTYLLVMMLVSILPFAGLMTYRIIADGNSQRERMQDDMRRSAKAFAQNVNRELHSTIDALTIISYTAPIQRGEAELFKQRLLTEPLLRPGWSGIYLISPGGAVHFDTAPPGPYSYPQDRDLAEFLARPVAQQTFISNLLGENGKANYATSIEVPVRVNGVVRYLLGARIPVSVWQNLVESSGLAADAVAALFDRNERLIARNHAPEVFVGTPRPAANVQMIAGQGSGSGRLAMFEGGSSYAAWDTVPLSGWGVGIGIPAAPIGRTYQRDMAIATAVSLVCLLLGVLLAFSVARRMTQPLHKLSHNEIPSSYEPIAVREIALLRDALVAFQVQNRAAQEGLRYKNDLLQKRAGEFETLLSSSPIGLAFAQDSHCRNITHNTAMDRLFGTSASHASGFIQVLHEGQPLSADQQPLQRAAAAGESTRDMELELQIEGRAPTFVIVNAVPLWDNAGHPRGAIGAVVDITERKAGEARLIDAEHRLRESQRLVDLAQEAGHVGFFHYHVATDALAWTPGLSKLLKLADNQTTKSLFDWARFIGEGGRERIERELHKAIAARQEKETFNYSVQLEDETELWLSSRIQLIYGDAGQPQHIIGVTVDLTEHKAAERERLALIAREQAARLEAESANRAKDVFLAMVSHELRNPLSAVTSAIAVLNRVGGTSELEVNARRILGRQTHHLAHMLDDLLDVARVISGHIALSRHSLDLGARVKRSIDTLKITGQSDRHEFTVDLQEVWIDADATRIEQVVNNLLTNAIKYTPPGGSIKVRVARDANDALLEVINSGPGISPELLPRVFDMFVQGERGLDRHDGGLGVGLTLVRRLVELHGGSTSAETNENGTAICARLPAVEAPVQTVQRPTFSQTRPRRLAIIEDNEDVLDALSTVLEVDGHTVWTATDGVSGLALLLNVRPEVAIVDIGLPGLTGYAVAKRSRSGGFAGRMIALSGYGNAADIEQALASGFDDYLLKPVDLQKLQDILAAIDA